MNAIVMVDQNWAIGKDGDQLLYIPADLKHFQQLTTGHPIILGRKTMGTFPGGRPLKNRRNLILSTRPGYEVEGGEVFSSLEALLEAAPADSFVVGGESVYRQMLPHCSRVYVTKLDAAYPADSYFPDLDENPSWKMAREEGPFVHEGVSYHYTVYERISE